MRRRRAFKGKRTANFTSQRASGSGVQFSKRRTTRRQWKQLIWNGSVSQTHYRSNQSTASSLTTTASPATMSVTLFPARRYGGNPFWTAAGGAINPDGGAIPTCATLSDFTIRGGMYGLRVSNIPDSADTDKDALAVTVFLVQTTKNF